MPLAKFVKVGNISNLSDARYCSGMGVDMLGFRAVEGEKNYISPAHFQEIRGWVTGPKIVAEVYGLKTPADITTILESYRPDFMEGGLAELAFLEGTSLPLIVSLSGSEAAELNNHPLRSHIKYLLVTDPQHPQRIQGPGSVLVDLSTLSLDEIPSSYADAGIALNGSPEIKPGLKSYEQLADVLEKLDVD